jgi:CheY-like chemotaxis protein
MAALRALVCDDEAPLRDLMARRLEKMGLEVERAESGIDARERIENNRYDLLVTDIYMPDVTGLELLQQMKAMDPHAQVVVVTASATLDNAVKALNDGAFAYLTKPFDHLTVFDNVVSRAIDFRRAILDNLRMGEVQRRRGDMLEEEVAGRIQQLKRTHEYLSALLGCLPFGVVVVDAKGRAELANPRAEHYLESVLARGGKGLLEILETVPLLDGERHGDVELDGRRLEIFLAGLQLEGDDPQQVLVLREPESGGPIAGTLVEELLLNLRRGLTWLARREKDPDARQIVRGMATEVNSLANLLDVELVHDGAPERPDLESVEGPASKSSELAPAVLPPPSKTQAEPPTEEFDPIPEDEERDEAPEGGNGQRGDAEAPSLAPTTGRKGPLPPPTGSLLLRKGMTMVLDGRIRRKKSRTEPLHSPEDADLMQEKIERWARTEESETKDPAWPPKLPSRDGRKA